MRNVAKHWFIMALACSVFSLLVIAGCATKTLSEKSTPLGDPQFTKGGETAFSLYYDFKDIPVPKEMKVKREQSFVFQTAELTAGMLSFSAKVEPDSLISYFLNKMPSDGWRFLSSFKSPKNILFFLKDNRFCIITITSKTFTTDLEILVTPSFQGGS